MAPFEAAQIAAQVQQPIPLARRREGVKPLAGVRVEAFELRAHRFKIWRADE
jgi:hypothetical protein